jgi:hypothetical protein
VLENGGVEALRGDRALTAVVFVHGLVMERGVLGVAELLTSGQLDASCAGYRFFGLRKIGALFLRAGVLLNCVLPDRGNEGRQLNDEYMRLVPSIGVLHDAFETMLDDHPELFAPLPE